MKLTPSAHIVLAANAFNRGETIYRAEPAAGRSLKQFHKNLSILARQAGHEWKFTQFDGQVIIKQRRPVAPWKLSQRGIRYDRR